MGLCSIRGSSFPPPNDVFDGHILYANDNGMDLSNVAWTFFETGSLGALPNIPVLPLLSPSALLALATGFASVGACLLLRGRSSHTL